MQRDSSRSRLSAFLRAVCLFAAAVLPAARAAAAPSATLSVEAAPATLEFVRGEPVVLNAKFANSGRTALVVDDYGEWLKNTVKVYVRNDDTHNLLLPRQGAPHSAVESLVLRPGESKTVSIRLGETYDLSSQGRFHATVVLDRDGETAESRPVSFSIVEGIELSARTRVPAGADESRPLRYALLYWTRNQGETLFLRVTDPSRGGAVAAFVTLGALVRVADPTLEFDADGIATVVQQISRDRFARTRLDLDVTPPVVLERDANLLSADALAERMNARAISERIDERQAEKEAGSGFFSRRRERTRKQISVKPGGASAVPAETQVQP